MWSDSALAWNEPLPSSIGAAGSALLQTELLLIYARRTGMGSLRRSLVLVLCAAAVVACDGGGAAETGRPDAGSSSATSASLAEAPTLVAYQVQCEPDYDTDCASEAAEFAGTVEVVDGCVLIDELLVGPTEPRSIAVLFPHGVSWSATDHGIVTSDGEVAHLGEWIYGGGGTSPLADLDVLDLTDEQRSDVKRCVAASDEPEVFFEMGANDSITRLHEPPDF